MTVSEFEDYLPPELHERFVSLPATNPELHALFYKVGKRPVWGLGRDLYDQRHEPLAIWIAAYASAMPYDEDAVINARAMFARFGIALLGPYLTFAPRMQADLLRRSLTAVARDEGTPPALQAAIEAELKARTPPERILALRAAVYANPTMIEPRLVLADALMELGDPLGQFIAEQVRGLERGRNSTRAKVLFDEHGGDWLGAWPGAASKPVWRGGVIVGLRVGWLPNPLPEDRSVVEVLEVSGQMHHLRDALNPEYWPSLRAFGLTPEYPSPNGLPYGADAVVASGLATQLQVLYLRIRRGAPPVWPYDPALLQKVIWVGNGHDGLLGRPQVRTMPRFVL